MSEWLGVVFPVPLYVTGEGEPYRPEAVMWFDADTSEVVGYELMRPVEAIEQAATLFHAATRAPLNGEPRTPTRIRVPSLELATALRAGVKGIDVVVEPTPELEDVIGALLEHMAEDDENDEPATLLQPGLVAADVAAFYTAAANVFAARPWDAVPLGSFVGVTCEALGIADGAMFIVGQIGPPCGFSLFRTEDDVVSYAEGMDADERGDTPENLPEHVIFNFGPRDEVAPTVLAEIEQHGFRVAGADAYPRVAVVDPDLVGRPLTQQELAGVTAILEALVQLVAAPELAAAWGGGPSVSVRGPSVELSAPLADLDERIADKAPLQRRAAALLEAMAPTIQDPETLAWASLFTEYAIAAHEALVHELSPTELQTLVFFTVPSDVTCAPEQAGAAIAGLRALLEHAAASPAPARARQLLQALPKDAAAQLQGRLADPTAFGPAKALIMAGAFAGFDMSTEEGVDEFLMTQELIGTEARARARQLVRDARKKS
jgi:hypothetical protein